MSRAVAAVTAEDATSATAATEIIWIVVSNGVVATGIIEHVSSAAAEAGSGRGSFGAAAINNGTRGDNGGRYAYGSEGSTTGDRY